LIGAESIIAHSNKSGRCTRQLLQKCPPAHREILRLKRQGLPLAEIATRTGLHEGSIRRILYDLARRLAVPRRTASTPPGAAQEEE
jgi:RNA polymerase sigma-70 factor (ECF subfamily)